MCAKKKIKPNHASKDRMKIRSLIISHNRKQDFLLSLLCTDLYHHCIPHLTDLLGTITPH